VRNRTRPLTDGLNGVEVVRIIEAAQRSLHDSGARVAIGESVQPAIPGFYGDWIGDGEGPSDTGYVPAAVPTTSVPTAMVPSLDGDGVLVDLRELHPALDDTDVDALEA
jgi:hypothetical protein